MLNSCDLRACVAATMPSPAQALRGALKESAGKLLTQLYDRNCRRPFAPSPAFQTSNLPPDRFQAEMQTAALAAGGLMQATNTRVWGLLRYRSQQDCCMLGNQRCVWDLLRHKFCEACMYATIGIR